MNITMEIKAWIIESYSTW